MKKFEITIDRDGKNEVISVESSSIIGALEKAHKTAQIEHGHTKESYRVKSACQVYPASVTGSDLIRSEYPIPGGPNPDMWEITGKIKPVKSDLTIKS